MCLPDSTKKRFSNNFTLTASELKNYRNLQNKIPDELYSVISDWKGGKATFKFKTSGSTGAPKDLEISRNRILLSAKKTIEFLGLGPGITALLALKLDYIAGFMVLVRTLESGMDLHYFQPSSDPFEKLRNHRKYFGALVPLQVNALLEKKYEIKNLQSLIIGGAALNHELRKKIENLPYPVFETYGMTETVSHIALRSLNGVNQSQTFKILKEIEIDQDENQLLKIRGDITDYEWITTNDIVSIINENEFEFLGRSDDVINSGGKKIHPLSLENEISNVAGEYIENREFVISSLDDDLLGQKAVLVIEGDELLTFNRSKLVACLKNIDKHLVPKSILYLSKFPRTNSGKINRKEIRELIK